MSILSPGRQVQRMPTSDVGSDQPMMSNVLPNLPPQIRLELEVSQRVIELGPGTSSAGLSDGCQWFAR